MPGTLMGNFFWEDGEVLMEDVLDGDVDRQIQAMTKYLIEMGYDHYSPNHPMMDGKNRKDRVGSRMSGNKK